ncbi:MAG: hypothetical protein ACXVHN_01060 [Methanobacterium sp.]
MLDTVGVEALLIFGIEDDFPVVEDEVPVGYSYIYVIHCCPPAAMLKYHAATFPFITI